MIWNKIIVIFAIEICAVYMLGRIFIPFFRKLRTGKLEFYLGDRFKKDGSEPKFGGIIIAAAMSLGLFLGVSILGFGYGLGESGSGKRIAAAYVYCLLLGAVGAAEDYAKDCRRSALGLKMRHKAAAQFIMSVGFLLVLYFQGDDTREVLLPFRMGYMNFGYLYYPLMGLMITGAVNAVKLNDCFAGDTSGSCDGLCPSLCAVFSLITACCCNITGNAEGQLYAYCVAGAFAAILIWNLSPAKLYIGESGSLFSGGVIASMVIISKIHFLFLLAGIGFIIDSACTLIQYSVFRKNRKLVFKGNSLHSHLKAKGWSDYRIIAVFSLITLIGGAGAVAFSVYSVKL